jgi:hypothetical protein
MDKELEKKSNNGAQTPEQTSNSTNGSKPPKAYESAMKAFAMTNKRLHPELYKGNSKVGKIRS